MLKHLPKCDQHYSVFSLEYNQNIYLQFALSISAEGYFAFYAECILMILCMHRIQLCIMCMQHARECINMHCFYALGNVRGLRIDFDRNTIFLALVM